MKSRRLLIMGSTLALWLTALAPGPMFAAGQGVSCASESSEWLLGDIDDIAEDFFPHLFASYPFADAGEFAAEITALFDKNGDGLACAKVSKGDDQNPRSHWYRQEIPLMGDEEGGPVYFLRVRDNRTLA